MTIKSLTKLNSIISEAAKPFVKTGKLQDLLNAIAEHKSELNKLFGKSQRKKKKDKNAPAKPKSSYILFCMEKRQGLKDKNPEMKATSITSELGKMWQKLSDTQKAKYAKKAEEDKKRYAAEMEDYTPPETDESDSGKKKKEKTGPKRSKSAYIFFCESERKVLKEEMPELKGKETSTELGKRWKELSDEDKTPFQALADEDKERYEAEKKAMGLPPTKKSKKAEVEKTESKTKKPAAKGKKDDKPSKAKPTETKKNAKAGKTAKETKEKATKGAKAKPVETKKSGKTAKTDKDPLFEYYAEQIRSEIVEENPNMKEKQITTEINKRWKALSDDDKESYKIQMNVTEDDEEEEDSDAEKESDAEPVSDDE